MSRKTLLLILVIGLTTIIELYTKFTIPIEQL